MITKRFVCGKGHWILLCLSLCMTGCGQKPEAFLTAQEQGQDSMEDSSSSQEPKASPTSFAPSPEPPQKELYYVDVCGAVVFPGVYTLPEGSRVFAAIDAAGGFAADAATTALNQALPLEDGAQIYVPTLEEVSVRGGETLPVASSQGLGAALSGEGKIDINHADVSQIEQIQGIGPSKARAIVEYRETVGPYTCAEDLLNVSGIGEGTLEKIKEQILVN